MAEKLVLEILNNLLTVLLNYYIMYDAIFVKVIKS